MLSEIMKKSFKIDNQDSDLATFERVIAFTHPEFKALKKDGKPSYEHPQFHHVTPIFRFLPGNNEPYCIHALNMFEKEDVEDYAWECQTLLERPISQSVESDENELNVRIVMQNIMNNGVFLHPVDKTATTMTKELTELVDYCFHAWDKWLSTQVKSNLAHEDARFSGVLLDEVVDACSYVADKLVDLARLDHMNQGQFSALRVNQKFALLAKSLIQIYLERLDGYVEDYLSELGQYLFKTMGYEKELRIETKRYVDLVLMHQLSTRSAKLGMEHTGINCEREVELKSPSTFIYTQRHGGLKADDIRRSYRWLFIKAWLYSWLKENEVSASKAARAIAEEDRFFYLDTELKKIGKADGLEETDDECFSRRQKTLNTEFSKWNKSLTDFGYISNNLFSKSKKGYEKQLNK